MRWPYDFFGDEYITEIVRSIQAIGCSTKPNCQELMLKKKDGSNVAVEAFHHPICEADGTVELYFSFLNDISECKLVETKNAILSTVIQNLGAAVISATLDGTITYWNTGAEKLYGYKKEGVIGKRIDFLFQAHR